MRVAAFHDALQRLAALTAMIGMGGLALLALFVCLSVGLRAGFDAPVTGDVEIVEAVCAVALYACLPWRRARGADAAVDVVARRLPIWGQGATRIAAAMLDAGLSLVIAWRLAEGGWDAWRNGDLSTALGIPLWWSYALMQPVSFALVVVSCGLCFNACSRPRSTMTNSPDHD